MAWEIYGITIFVSKNAPYCPLSTREIIIMLKCFDCCIWILLMCVIWCSFDPAGKSWVKMKRFQDSLKEDNSKYKYRRSAGSQRNWRHREAVRQYEKSWKNRFRKLCCIVQFKDRGDVSFALINDYEAPWFLFHYCYFVEFFCRSGSIIIRVFPRLGRRTVRCDCWPLIVANSTESGTNEKSSKFH